MSTGKKCIRFENIPTRIPTNHNPEFLWQVQVSQKSIERPNKYLLDPGTLTYDLDLGMLPLDLHAKIQFHTPRNKYLRHVFSFL